MCIKNKIKYFKTNFSEYSHNNSNNNNNNNNIFQTDLMQKQQQEKDSKRIETFSFFDSMNCMIPKTGEVATARTAATPENKENTIESSSASVKKSPRAYQSTVFAAFAISLNIDPKLLDIITDGDDHVECLSGRSSNNSPAGSGRSTPRSSTPSKDTDIFQ